MDLKDLLKKIKKLDVKGTVLKKANELKEKAKKLKEKVKK